MANTTPVTDTAEAAERVSTSAGRPAWSTSSPVGAVTKGLAGEELAELGLMARSRARVRVFSDDGHCVADARVMRRALEYVKAFGGVISQHAQDPGLAGPDACCHEGELSGRLGLPGWPGIAEESIVARDVMLARHTGRRVHVAHVSTAGSVEVIRWAKAQGIDVTAEVTPHHLLLTTDLLAAYDPVCKVNPPLRPDGGRRALREALADGTIDAVATDHAPHARHDKEHAFVDAASGMLGLETALGGGQRGDGRAAACSTGPASPRGHVGQPGPDRPARGPRPAARRRARRPTSRSSTPRASWTVDRDALALAVAQQPLARPHADRPASSRPSSAARAARPRRPRPHPRARRRPRCDPAAARPRARDPRPRGRPHVPRRAYGAVGETVGEAVFSTGMTGYQETLTDPSYHRQVVVMTAPHVGNTGINTEDPESRRIWVSGYVVRDPALRPSSWRSTKPLEDELRDQGVVGISGIDTRALTRHLRERGAMRVGIFSGDEYADRRRRRSSPRVRTAPSMAGADAGRRGLDHRALRRGAVGRSGSRSPRSTSGSRR